MKSQQSFCFTKCNVSLYSPRRKKMRAKSLSWNRAWRRSKFSKNIPSWVSVRRKWSPFSTQTLHTCNLVSKVWLILLVMKFWQMLNHLFFLLQFIPCNAVDSVVFMTSARRWQNNENFNGHIEVWGRLQRFVDLCSLL